ncbi:MAG: GNAT family N-acetyltransferase [Bacteroidales bacterium]|jgi:hypothetical protein|nr:GNAT family N-acetyltransferase [Bacteroidales bacterium]
MQKKQQLQQERERNKEKYRILCSKQETIPIFLTSWWMDSATNCSWDVILMEENNEIIAALPYYIIRKLGFKIVVPPHLSPINGPWIRKKEGISLSHYYLYEIEVMEYFAKELDKLKLDYYCHKFDHSLISWLGFYWNNYKETTFYKYRIEDTSNLDIVYKNISPRKRRMISKAEKILSIEKDIDNKSFYDVLKLSFQRQNKNIPYSFSFFDSIEKASKEKNRSQKLVAKDGKGNIYAVMFLVFDIDTTYILATGADPKHRDSGAMDFIHWYAIKDAHNHNRKVDLTGSMMKNVENYLRWFGGKLTPYLVIEKSYSKIYSLIRHIRLNH